MRLIIDVNLWVSFCIGQHLDDLPIVLSSPLVELFICKELEHELADVLGRPRLAKYVRKERIQEVYHLLDAYSIHEVINRTGADFLDVKDNYLLDFARSIEAHYLVTGDHNLLALKTYIGTEIISFRTLTDLLKAKPK